MSQTEQELALQKELEEVAKIVKRGFETLLNLIGPNHIRAPIAHVLHKEMVGLLANLGDGLSHEEIIGVLAEMQTKLNREYRAAGLQV